jgi:hypothetical protein
MTHAIFAGPVGAACLSADSGTVVSGAEPTMSRTDRKAHMDGDFVTLSGGGS